MCDTNKIFCFGGDTEAFPGTVKNLITLDPPEPEWLLLYGSAVILRGNKERFVLRDEIHNKNADTFLLMTTLCFELAFYFLSQDISEYW